MPGDNEDNRTVALTREAKAQLAAEAKALISQQGAPVVDDAPADADATIALTADRKADLHAQARALIEQEQAAAAPAVPPPAAPAPQAAAPQAEAPVVEQAAHRPRTKVAFTSSQVAPVGDDLLPFEAAADDGFDDMAKTEALGSMDAPPPGLTPPPPAPAPSSSLPSPSPTQFDIDVATRFKQEADAVQAASAQPDVAEPSPPASGDDALQVPPTTGLEGVPSTHHAESYMPKTAMVDMQAELDDGTGMLKVLAGVAVLIVVIAVVLLLLR